MSHLSLRRSTAASSMMLAVTVVLAAGAVTAPATAAAPSGSGSSTVSVTGSLPTSSDPLGSLLATMRDQIYTVTDAPFLREPLAHAVLTLDKNTPVVVLGAQINEDCSLPQVLEDRLDAATRLLKSHPDNPVIVTGGRSSQCPATTEAEAMEKGLRDRGVTNRVILENEAWNTLQNVAYTAPLIRELGGTAVVVTSDPHYIRALRNYRDAGIRAFGWVGGIG